MQQAGSAPLGCFCGTEGWKCDTAAVIDMPGFMASAARKGGAEGGAQQRQRFRASLIGRAASCKRFFGGAPTTDLKWRVSDVEWTWPLAQLEGRWADGGRASARCRQYAW